MLGTWFWCLSPGFWAWEIDWDHFQTHQIDLSGQNGHFGNFGQVWIGQNCNLGSEHTTDLIWCLFPGFWTWEIDWDHFQTPQIDLSDQNGHFGQFWPCLNWPKLNLGSEHATDLILVSIPRFLGMGNWLRAFPGVPPPWSQFHFFPFLFCCWPSWLKELSYIPWHSDTNWLKTIVNDLFAFMTIWLF